MDLAGRATTLNAAMLRILGCGAQEELAGPLNFLRDVFRYTDQQAQLFTAHAALKAAALH